MLPSEPMRVAADATFSIGRRPPFRQANEFQCTGFARAFRFKVSGQGAGPWRVVRCRTCATGPAKKLHSSSERGSLLTGLTKEKRAPPTLDEPSFVKQALG